MTSRNPNAGRTPEQQALINAKISASRKGKGTGPRNGQVRTCEHCSSPFPAHSRGKRFCSMACKSAVVSEEYKNRKIAEYLNSPHRCPCGEPIAYDRRNTAKYCSDEHRKKYGPPGGPKKDPTKHVTFNCLNCDKEVTRYKGYGKGHNKYCSNTCAQRHTKVRKFYTVDNFDIVFESSYEAFFWGACLIAKIPVERFDRKHGVQWRDDDSDNWYAPDFWLPTLKLAVETKGHQDPEDEYRWTLYRDQVGPLLVLMREDLVDLSPDSLLARLSLALQTT